MNRYQMAITAAALAAASSIVMAQSQGSVKNSSVKTDLEQVTIRTTAATGGLSIGPLKINAAVGGGNGDVLIGSITACDGGVIESSTVDVRMRNVTARTTGAFKVGIISAGC